MFTWIIRNGKSPLPITLEETAVTIVDDFSNRGLSFDDGFLCPNGQHPRMLRLLIQKKIVTRPRSCLITFLALLKIGIKKLPRKLYGLKSHLRLPE